MTLWIPGKFPSLNDLVALAISTGVRRQQAAEGVRPRDPMNERATETKNHVALMAASQRWRAPREQVRVRVWFVGHGRWDADAGAWAAKLIVDALFGQRRDGRAYVLSVLSYVHESPPEVLARLVAPIQGGGAGVVVNVEYVALQRAQGAA